jgi:hypothetical protein
MHLLQVLTVRPQRVCEATAKASSCPPGAELDKPSAGPRSAAADLSQWWNHQGTFWRGHPNREPRANVPEPAFQEVFHQHQSDDHLAQDDGEVLPEVPQREAGAVSCG